MTTAADDTAGEAAFEAFLAGRPVPEEAADLAAFAGAVRATATLPGRPNAALAELLATGLLTDQSSPSTRTAPSAGSSPRRSRVRRRRRFAMFFPALLAKFLSAGAVAQAASGAGIVVVAFTGAGVVGALPGPVQDTFSSVVGTDSTEVTTPDDATVTGDDATATADPAEVDGTAGETTAPVEPTAEAFDPAAWVAAGPADAKNFGAWVSESAHNDELRQWLRSQGMTFGSMVRGWAHKNGMDDADLADEGVDLADLTDEPTTAPVTGATDGTDDGTDDSEVASTHRGSGSGHGNGGSDSNTVGSSSGNGHGRGHN